VPGPSILLILIVSLALAAVILAFFGLSSSGLDSGMHAAAKMQFERAGREFARWRAVPDDDRSPAPAICLGYGPAEASAPAVVSALRTPASAT
jgi:hypothetical protein